MARLVTIQFSHYCEKARWGLERAGIPYVEEAHAPVLHLQAALRAGGRRTVPVLVTPEAVLRDSSAILLYADAAGSRGPGALYPTAPEARREVRALEALCDERLGPHARRWAYFHLLERRDLVVPLIRRASPRFEGFAFAAAFPLMRGIMRRAMRITEAGAARSRDHVLRVFDEVAGRLTDGRPFLAGDVLTAADIAFTALAAPLLAPEGYGAELPALDALPPALRTEVDALRATPAGAFALRLYQDERRPAAAAAPVVAARAEVPTIRSGTGLSSDTPAHPEDA